MQRPGNAIERELGLASNVDDRVELRPLLEQRLTANRLQMHATVLIVR